MAEFRLSAGATVDLLTKGEVADALHQQHVDSQIERARGVKWMRLPVLAGILTGTYPTTTSHLGGPGQCGPNPGYVWALRRVSATGLSAATSGSTTTSTATGSITAGAGSAALANGVSATGFTLSFSAAPSTTGTAILSNVTGGSQTFNIPSGQTSPYTVTFPGPITTTSAGVAATLTIAGLGTGAGNIELYGQSVTAATAADQLYLYRNEQVPQQFIAALTGQIATNFVSFTNVQAVLAPGDDLLIGPGTTFSAAGVITVTAEAIEVPAEMLWKVA